MARDVFRPGGAQVHRREDVVGLDSSIIASPKIWQSSGHVEGFSDPMVDCKVLLPRLCNKRVFIERMTSGRKLKRPCRARSQGLDDNACTT
jgi:glycyl-tRNA synthetase (class II)